MNRKYKYGLLLFLIIFLFSTPALAKKKPKPKTLVVEKVEFRPEQVILNAQAAQATNNGEYEKAELLFKATLEIEEFDLTWLNLGRTYARQGKCLDAREAYQKVRTTRHVDEVALDDINSALTRFETELNEMCAAQFERADAKGGAGGYMSDEQISLNKEAAEATQAGDYEKAELLFKAILRMKEFDFIWLNLGRTYAKHNKCIEAREAYSHVLGAPVLRETAHIDIKAKLEGFQADLEAQCSEQFHKYDTWHETSKTYSIAGWTLVGVGSAALLTSIILFAADVPTGTNPYEAFIAEDIYYKTEEGELFKSQNDKYKTQVLALKTGILVGGIAIAATGAALLIVDYLKFGEWKKAEKLQKASNAEQALHQPGHFWWTPSVVIAPEFSGLGISGSF